jgi:hypothetical protein
MLTNWLQGNMVRRFYQFAACTLLLVLVSCGGSSVPTGAPPASGDPPFDPGLPSLQQLAAGGHQVSAPMPHVINGSDAIAKSDAAAVLDTSMEIPSDFGTAEWAIYQFATGGEPLLDLTVDYTDFSGTSTWVALGNFAQSAWVFSGPYPVSGPPIDISGGAYVSPGNDFFFAVVTFDGTFSKVNSATINTDVAPTTFAISGTVLQDGTTALPGVQMTLNPGAMNATTDSAGDYQFSGVSNGAYTVTPELSGYVFTPVSQNVNVSDADETGVDFSATAQALITYTSDIKDLLDTNCVGCHKAGHASGGIQLDTYTTAKSNANAANEKIQSGQMPPGGPLSAGEKALFQDWLDDGLLE